MSVQIVFSYLNKRCVENVHKSNPQIHGKYNILAVGYREDPDLFKKCLKSLVDLENQENINKILIVIDGNDTEDNYMADIAREVVGACVINSQELLSQNSGCLDDFPLLEKVHCILQPHKGKRHALYTGLKLSCDQKVDGVMCTDSDTELEAKSFYYLCNLLESKESYGAVTGNVKIINDKASIISYLSSLRYWFACNLERGYQSFNNCVLCVSGPLGLYRTECLEIFLQAWLDQKFLSKECTYGDDRHLTNNILLLGKKIGYTHLSGCLTDTPETIKRFFNQQNRWCKSSFREFVWNIKCLHKHSLWMTIDLIYQTLYSFIVLGSLVFILFFGTTFQLMFYMATLLVFNAIKGAYACVITGTLKYLLFTFYGIIYVSLLAPAKLYAGMTLGDVGWGTSSRLVVLSGFEVKHIFLILWNMLIVSGVVYNFVTNFPYRYEDILAIGCVLGYVLFTFIFIVFFR